MARKAKSGHRTTTESGTRCIVTHQRISWHGIIVNVDIKRRRLTLSDGTTTAAVLPEIAFSLCDRAYDPDEAVEETRLFHDFIFSIAMFLRGHGPRPAALDDFSCALGPDRSALVILKHIDGTRITVDGTFGLTCPAVTKDAQHCLNIRMLTCDIADKLCGCGRHADLPSPPRAG